MNQITFRHDTVLSDVHLLLPNTRHLMIRLNSAGQPVFISKFKILWDLEKQDTSKSNSSTSQKSEREDETEKGETVEEVDEAVDPTLDEDGDLEVKRRPRQSNAKVCDRDEICPIILSKSPDIWEEEGECEDHQCLKDFIRIEHTMATPLEDVGKQVWRGALLLADFILTHPAMFRGATVLELGAGTGFTSVVMATVAKTVYCTDVGEDLLSMCQKNLTLNKHLLEPTGGEVKVRKLDWLRRSLCTDTDVEFSWTEEEVADLHDNTSFIIAADVCYDDDLTDGLFRTLYQLCTILPKPCTTYFSIEKRMNFTLRQMNVSCEAYDHFRHCLSELQNMADGRNSFSVEKIPATFPQCLHYERIEQLELWKVTVTPLGWKEA